MFFKNLKRKKETKETKEIKKAKEAKEINKKIKVWRYTLGMLAIACTVFATANGFSNPEIPVSKSEINCKLIPSGQAVGMRFKTKGVMVVGVESGNLPAQKAGVKIGDIIIKVNQVSLQNTRHFEEILHSIGENTVTLTILREDKPLLLDITPQRNQANQLVFGMWLRDSAAGIGTVTFFTEDKKQFAALGHPLNDSDTEKTYSVRKGQVELVEIKGAKKAEKGRAGELIGVLSDIPVGIISQNTQTGLSGTLENEAFIQREAVFAASKREVKLGKATILSTVSETGTCEYEIEIVKILEGKGNRDFIIRITDEDLLSQTGGIVQGMSGSPILQNGKIIGAVTHVLVNDSTRGYGISVERMLAKAEEMK